MLMSTPKNLLSLFLSPEPLSATRLCVGTKNSHRREQQGKQGVPLQSPIPETDLIECFPQSSGLLAVMMENDSLYNCLEVLTEAFPVVGMSFRDTDASAEHSRYLL